MTDFLSISKKLEYRKEKGRRKEGVKGKGRKNGGTEEGRIGRKDGNVTIFNHINKFD